MAIHRLKHTCTAGELSPLMNSRTDFDRFKNGCRKLYNAVCATQGPAVRRPGFAYIYDLVSLGMDVTNPLVRLIPFKFNKLQAYALIFYMHTDGQARMVLGYGNGLVTYSATPPTECPPGTPVTLTPGDIVTLTLPVDWDLEAFDWAQSADEITIAQSGLQPHVIKRYEHECWGLVAKTYTDQPTDWSAANGWPERVTYHQQRLVFAANTLRRQTVWMSKAGDFDDFGISSPLVDSDAVTFTLDSGTQNKIQWVSSGKALFAGTLGDEWTVTGNNENALTHENILSVSQTNDGSEPNKPLKVGLTTLFVEMHGRRVNEFVYDYTYDSYKTSDMAILSSHVTKDYSITDWTYQKTPDSIIWCVREDGDLLGITYQRQHKVIGWHHHGTEGAFKAVTCIPGSTREDDVWVVVKRVIDGSDKYYVEKLADWFKADEAEWGRFVDSHTVYQDTPVSSLSGLDHLEGKEVQILADGTVHAERTVTSGQISLDSEYSHIVVGLGYETDIRPYAADIVSKEDGSLMGRMQRITNIDIDFYNSLGCYIGRINELGETTAEEEIPFRVPSDLTGQQVPLFTGIKHLPFPEGFDREPNYFIKQKQPLPLTIRGVIDSIEVYE